MMRVLIMITMMPTVLIGDAHAQADDADDDADEDEEQLSVLVPGIPR